MTRKLTAEERTTKFSALEESGWTICADRDAIRKTYKFRNFSEAFGWMARTALAAEKLNHHPEWHNVYNVVEVVLATHSIGGLSDLDIKLAKTMDRLSEGCRPG